MSSALWREKKQKSVGEGQHLSSTKMMVLTGWKRRMYCLENNFEVGCRRSRETWVRDVKGGEDYDVGQQFDAIATVATGAPDQDELTYNRFH
jgi:hypothetical protein